MVSQELQELTPKLTPTKALARELRACGLRRVAIDHKPGVPTILAGAILEAAGVTDSNREPVIRADKRSSSRLEGEVIPLYGPNILNPTLLREFVTTISSPRGGYWGLCRLLEQYRSCRQEDNWWQIGRAINKPQFPFCLHEIVSLSLLRDWGDPRTAYKKGVKMIHELSQLSKSDLVDVIESQRNRLYEEISLDDVEPVDSIDGLRTITVKAPFFKSEVGEPDVIETGYQQFYKGRIRLLVGSHIPIVIGGSPNSGKSTFTASLTIAMKRLAYDCYQEGITDSELKIDVAELDVVSPTVAGIYTKSKRPVRKKYPMTEEGVNQAVALFTTKTSENNVVLGDLPGGTPDRFTRMLARPGQFSIIVDRHYGEELKPWRNVFAELDLPPTLAYIRTCLNEPDRHSGIRIFRSRSQHTKHKDIGLRGRVVNLDGEHPKPNDEVVNFLAHVLLFDYLPQLVLDRYKYKESLMYAVGLS